MRPIQAFGRPDCARKTSDTRYNQVNWNDENAAINKFKEQLEEWYIEPIESLLKDSRHYGFAVVALTCILIDTLAQYYEGKELSREQFFKEFLRSQFLVSYGINIGNEAN